MQKTYFVRLTADERATTSDVVKRLKARGTVAGLWRSERTASQIARLEGWGGRALAARGYELTVPLPQRRPPLWLYARTCWRAAWWLATRHRFGSDGGAGKNSIGQSPSTGARNR